MGVVPGAASGSPVGSSVSPSGLDVHPSTATRLCDRLVRKGLVTRTRPDEGRRTTPVALATPGRAVVDR